MVHRVRRGADGAAGGRRARSPTWSCSTCRSATWAAWRRACDCGSRRAPAGCPHVPVLMLLDRERRRVPGPAVRRRRLAGQAARRLPPAARPRGAARRRHLRRGAGRPHRARARGNPLAGRCFGGDAGAMGDRIRLAKHWPLFGLSVRTASPRAALPDGLGPGGSCRPHRGGPRARLHAVPGPVDSATRRGASSAACSSTTGATGRAGASTSGGSSWSPSSQARSSACRASSPRASRCGARPRPAPGWRGLSGQGIGKEMRLAMLHLAFVGLGAALGDRRVRRQPASLGVTRQLGYSRTARLWHDGSVRRPVSCASSWTATLPERSGRDDVEITGLGPCLPLFGLGDDEPGR